MRLDASGNLGLGVTPSAWTGTHKAIQLQGGGSVYNNGADGYINVASNSYYDGTNQTYVKTAAATRYIQSAGAHTWYTAPSGTAGNAITFTQAMTLDASGNLGVGTSTTSSLTNTNSVVLNAVSGYQIINHMSGSADGSNYSYFAYNGAAIGSITQSGTTAVAYNTTSDHRLKTNIRPADAARFMGIEFMDYERIDGRHECGVIADQLQLVYPDLVLGEKDATEVRTVEISPAVPAVTEKRLVSAAIPAVTAVAASPAVMASPAEYTTVTTEEVVLIDGIETTITRSKLVETKPAVEAKAAVEEVIAVAAVEAVYEDVEITPAIPAVTEEQTFPVYQQVNYMGLIGRMGTRVQQLQRTVDAQALMIAALESRLSAAGIP